MPQLKIGNNFVSAHKSYDATRNIHTGIIAITSNGFSFFGSTENHKELRDFANEIIRVANELETAK